MNLSSRVSLRLGLLLLCSPLVLPGTAGACIWPFSEPAFWREPLTGPEREAMLAGRVGILDSSWNDPGIFVAWRHFEGFGMPKESWPDFRDDGYPSVPRAEGSPAPAPWVDPITRWENAVKSVTGEEILRMISRETSAEEPDGQGGTTYSYFLNCLDPAFDTAAAALVERRERWGKDSREVAEWLRGQRQVFDNCGEAGENPPELDESWPADLRADRRYQIAAADFYAMRYPAAAEGFRRIAADKSSPWAKSAAFSLPRCTLRSGRYAQAATEFRALLADRGLAEYHESAERLARFAELRAAPEQQAGRLEKELSARKLAETADVQLYDARWLASRLPPADERPLIFYLRALSPWQVPATEVYAHWRKSPSPANLVLAMIRAIDAWVGDDAVAEGSATPKLGAAESEALVVAAAKVGKESAAYLSARYYRASLLATLGRRDEARQELDRLIAEKVGGRADRQRLAHDRAHLARDWDELATFGLMSPLGETNEEKSRVYFADAANYNKELAEDDRLLIPVATLAINRFASLAELERLQRKSELPRRYRRELALAGFLRAALSGREEAAEGFATAAQGIEPELAALFAEWRQAPDPGHKKFEAAWLSLRQPGMSIDLWPTWGRGGVGRDELDDTRQNWWCAAGELPDDRQRPEFLRGKMPPQDAAGGSAGPNQLGREVLAYAKKYPDDPRLPEALHRTVKATRLGCWGEPFAEVSKAAFNLLHRRFPKNEWTAQTPYWFE